MSSKSSGGGSKPSQDTKQDVPNPAGNSGPGTGADAEPEKVENRPPSSTLGDPKGAALEPPTQAEPVEGHHSSTTDPVYAEAGGRTVAGEDYARLVGEDGKALDADDLFEGDDAKTWVTTKTRIVEEFYYPNTTTLAHRLMFAKGRRVPRPVAERIKAAVKSAPTPVAEQ